MRWRRAFWLACVAGVAACSGYSSTNGGGDAADGGGAPDASSDGATTTPPGPASDAGPDGPWCVRNAPDANVCDDFDEPGTFSGKWKDTNAYHATLDVVDDPAAPSRPRVLALTTDGAAPDISTAELVWSEPSATSIAYGFSVRIDHVADGGAPDLSLFELAIANADANAYVTIHLGASPANVTHFSEHPDGGPIYGRQIPLPALDDGKWHDVVVRLSLVPPRPITVSVDGASPKEDELQQGFDTGSYQMHAGVTFATVGNDGWKLAVDNAWIESH